MSALNDRHRLKPTPESYFTRAPALGQRQRSFPVYVCHDDLLKLEASPMLTKLKPDSMPGRASDLSSPYKVVSGKFPSPGGLWAGQVTAIAPFSRRFRSELVATNACGPPTKTKTYNRPASHANIFLLGGAAENQGIACYE